MLLEKRLEVATGFPVAQRRTGQRPFFGCAVTGEMDGFPLNIKEAVCLGASLTLSGICYYLYRKSWKTLQKVDASCGSCDAPHFTIDETLKDILKVTPGACLQYAVIEGAVKPVGEPLTSPFQKEFVGVLQRFVIREHRLVWNRTSRTWCAVTGEMDGFPLNFKEAVCLGASLTLSGICYYLYRKSWKTLQKVDDAPHFTIDGKLKDILKLTPGACLQYAVIEGAVKPVGEPLTSPFQKEAVGVLQRFMIREHKLVWNRTSRTWTDSERVLHHRVNAVPFVLVGSNETTVRVQCPLQASGLHMETTHEKFHQVNHGLGDIIGQYLSGEKLKGQLETEEMLKVGTTVTGVGELILDMDGTLNLRPPSNGSEYFLSNTGWDTLRGEQGSKALLWKALTIVSALAATSALFWVARRYYRQLKVHWEREKERREFQRLSSEGSRAGAPVESPEALQDEVEVPIENACVICLTQPRNCIILDCGHVCCCYSCYQALPRCRCPICRQNISRVVPLYNV